MLQFRLLGGLSLHPSQTTPSQPVIYQPKRLALLSYLAVESREDWVARETLLAVFWPEIDGNRARASLRKALHFIRAALGADSVLNRGEEYLRLNPERVRCDAVEFDAMVRAGQDERALDLYRGAFLPGLFVDDAPGFERWLDAQRARLSSLARAAALRVLREAERRGEHDRALRLVRRVEGLFPEDEEMVRHAMRLFQLQGDRVGALRVFERLEARLRTEYEMAPAPETLRMAEALRAEVMPSDAVPGRPRVQLGTPLPIREAATLAPSFRELVEELPEALFRTDAEWRLEYVNPVMCTLTGHPVEVLLEMSYLDLLHPDGRDEALGFYLRRFHEGAPRASHEIRLQRRDGREAWAEVTVRLLEREGELDGVVGVARDVSASRRVLDHQRNGALHDRATGLLGRHAFDLLLDRKARLARRLGRPFSFLRVQVSDVDDEELNTDQAVQSVSTALRRHFRDCDSIARLGPGTLAALPEEADSDVAGALVERLECALCCELELGRVPARTVLRLEALTFDPASAPAGSPLDFIEIVRSIDIRSAPVDRRATPHYIPPSVPQILIAIEQGSR